MNAQFEARRAATNLRVKRMYDIICDNMALHIGDIILSRMDSFSTCNIDHFMLTDIHSMCMRILNRDFPVLSRSDRFAIQAMLTFKQRDGEPFEHLATFSALRISTPIVQVIINIVKAMKYTAFDVSDSSKSSLIMMQIRLMPDASAPVPASRKRARSSYSPTSPGYSPTSP